MCKKGTEAPVHRCPMKILQMLQEKTWAGVSIKVADLQPTTVLKKGNATAPLFLKGEDHKIYCITYSLLETLSPKNHLKYLWSYYPEPRAYIRPLEDAQERLLSFLCTFWVQERMMIYRWVWNRVCKQILREKCSYS